MCSFLSCNHVIRCCCLSLSFSALLDWMPLIVNVLCYTCHAVWSSYFLWYNLTSFYLNDFTCFIWNLFFEPILWYLKVSQSTSHLQDLGCVYTTNTRQHDITPHTIPQHTYYPILFYHISFFSFQFNSIQFNSFLLCFLALNIYCCRYDGFLFIKITLFNNKCKLNIKLISGNTRKKKRNIEKNCYYGSKKKNHEVN